MDIRYQIFVSSTFSDLLEERQAVTQGLLSLDHFPAGMELFPASDDDAWEMIKSVIDDSDYYVLVIAGRYGSLSSEGVSYTEREYDYAVSLGLPILAFLHQEPDSIPVAKSETDSAQREALEAFKGKVQSGHHVKFWHTADDLKAKVIQSVSAETKRNPREGWIRASNASDPAQLNRLIQENSRLSQEISQARNSPPEGAENLQRGDDAFEVKVFTQVDYGVKGKWTEVSVNWNTILWELGPLLLQECSENKMEAHLDSALYRYHEELAGKKYAGTYISKDWFETIKIQLIALGLIKKSERKHAISDKETYWSITPYGERSLMQLRARRRVKS